MKTLVSTLLGAALIAAHAPALAQSTAAPAAAKSTSSTYHISPGDQLQIYVWGDERLQRQLTVLPDGTFAFPLAGTVTAAGHTPNEVEDALSKLLAPQYKNVPQQVTVSVIAPAGMQYSVIGKVHAPGNFAPTRYVNVLNALAQAGGPTDFADIGNIIILRTTAGRTEVVRTRLGSIFKGKPGETELNAASVPLIQAGDTVVVP